MKSYSIAIVSAVLFSLPAFADTTTTPTTPAAPPAPASNIASLNLNVNDGSSNSKPTAAAPAPASPSASKTLTLATDTDRASYAIGVNIGQNFKSQGLTMNSDAIAQGIKDGYSGNKTLMNAEDIQTTLLSFQKQLIAKRQAQLTQAGNQNMQTGASFLADNKTKPGVVTLPDGLQYKIIEPGDSKAASPTDSDLVTVNYTGTLINGQVFDSSYQRGKPVTFAVNQVIPGWTEALKLMKPGATWELYIPANLAYGDRGMGPIGPNQTLIFKVNLIAVNPAPKN